MSGFTHADTAVFQASSAVTSSSVTLSGAIGVGDLVCIYFNAGTISSETVSASPSIGTWNFMAAGTNFTRAAYCIVTTAQAGGTTITTTGGGSNVHRSLVADRFSVSGGSVVFGNTANVAASGTSGNLGSLSSVPAGALLWGALHSDTASSTFTAGSSNSVSATIGSQTSNANGSDFSEYILSAAGGTESMTWTCSPTISGLNGWQAYFTINPIVKDATGTAVKQTGAATSATVDITTAATGAWVYFSGCLSANQTGVTFTGWTQVLEGDESTFSHYLVYRRLKQAGDTTFTISWPTSARLVGNWESYTGLDGTTPDELAAFTAHTTGTTFPTSSLTPNGTGRWALAFSYARDSTLATDLPDGTTWTPDAALTERTDAANAAAGTAVWMSIETADSNGTVTQAAHSYTATAAHTETHGGAVLLFLNPPAGVNVTGVGAAVSVGGGVGTPSGGGIVTGVGAAVAVAGGIGTPSGSANVTGVGAQISVAGGVGSLSAADVVTGVGAAITAAGGIGTPSGSANVTGVGASVATAAGIGTPSGAGKVTGVGAAVAVAGGAGTLSGSDNLTGVGAQVSVAAGLGTVSAGVSITGVGAAVSAAGGLGTPSGSANVTGVGAAVSMAAGLGTPSGAGKVTGVGASVSAAAGVGTPSAGENITGVGAQVAVAGGIGSPNAGGSFNVIGVGAQVTVAGGVGTVAAGAGITGVGASLSAAGGVGTPSGSANVPGVGALVTTAAGVGALAAAANVQGVAALQAIAGGLGTPVGSAQITGVGAQVFAAGGIGTPAGVLNGAANVTGIGAVVSVAGGIGMASGVVITTIITGRTMAFQARSIVTAQATLEFNAGQPRQAGLVTLASDPWIATSPDIL